jgi:hypothetical protein
LIYQIFFSVPLCRLLFSALDKGVVVIAAHCASEGKSADIESDNKPLTSNFQLFLRLFSKHCFVNYSLLFVFQKLNLNHNFSLAAEEKYQKNFFADISAMTAFKRLGEPLTTMLNREDLHSRLGIQQ